MKRGLSTETKLAMLATIGVIVFGAMSIASKEPGSDEAEAAIDAQEEMAVNNLDVEFEVIKDISDPYKRTVEVMLPERVSEKQLTTLAKHLHEPRDGNTFIGYYIEDEGDYAYWATTHYDPEMTVRIIGSTQAQEQETESAFEDADYNIVGKWRVNRGYSSIITILEEGGNKLLIQRFQDGSEMNEPLQEREVGGNTQLSDEGGRQIGEYYIIGEDGRLQFWSDNGNYYTAPIDN